MIPHYFDPWVIPAELRIIILLLVICVGAAVLGLIGLAIWNRVVAQPEPTPCAYCTNPDAKDTGECEWRDDRWFGGAPCQVEEIVSEEARRRVSGAP